MFLTSVIVATWLLLTGAVGDAVLAGADAPLRLVALEGAGTALTLFALWLAVGRDAPRARRRRARWRYD